MQMKILIVGGVGGIGAALIEAFSQHYQDADIYATYHERKPSDKALSSPVIWYELDVSVEEKIARMASEFTQLDILIDATGILYDENHSPEKCLEHFDLEFFYTNIQLNTVPSIFLAKYFSKALKASVASYFVTLSARIGSLGDNKKGGWLSYRTSKAALNMAMKTIAIEWRYKLPNTCLLIFHPGTTDSHLSKPFQKNIPDKQLQTPDFTAQALLKLIWNATLEDSGNFYDFNGESIEW